MLYSYRIKIPFWSATDYSFMVNHTNGWVDDNEDYYEFENEDDFQTMKGYLEQQSGCIFDGGETGSTGAIKVCGD